MRKAIPASKCEHLWKIEEHRKAILSNIYIYIYGYELLPDTQTAGT